MLEFLEEACDLLKPGIWWGSSQRTIFSRMMPQSLADFAAREFQSLSGGNWCHKLWLATATANATAAAAAVAAVAAAAAYAAAVLDSSLSDYAERVVQILIDMNAPGCQWLSLVPKEESQWWVLMCTYMVSHMTRRADVVIAVSNIRPRLVLKYTQRTSPTIYGRWR